MRSVTAQSGGQTVTLSGSVELPEMVTASQLIQLNRSIQITRTRMVKPMLLLTPLSSRRDWLSRQKSRLSGTVTGQLMVKPMQG